MKLPLLTVSLALALSTQAQTPQLVYDLLPGNADSSSYPTQLISFNNKLHFVAYTPIYGSEIWTYDGVNPPAVLDVFPGPHSGASGGHPDRGTSVMNGKLYFSGTDDSLTGYELMVYDGVSAPSLVADISPGATNSWPRNHVNINGKLFFVATMQGQDHEVFVYDGVNAPVFHNVNPGVYPNLSSYPHSYTELNGKVYFGALKVGYGFELFAYDLATNVVNIAQNINPGADNSMPSNIIRFGNKIYFTAGETFYGKELYSYDGWLLTRLTDIAPNGSHGADKMIGIYNNELYFSGATANSHYQLYKYDTTSNTATLVHTINQSGSAGIIGGDAIVYAGKLYFTANDGINGRELWVHDGTNTNMVADLYPGSMGSDPIHFCINGGSLYFSANDGTHGQELFSLTDPETVKGVKLNGTITLSPNPTSGNATLLLSLKASCELSITITDALGKLIWEKATTNYPSGNTDVVLPVAEQSAGIYFYTVKDNSGKTMASGKLQKQ